MVGFRIISKREIKESLANGTLLKNEEHPPYDLSEVICFFQANDYRTTFNKYSDSLADLRSLYKGELLYLLKLEDLEEENIERDNSQNGWTDSYVYTSDINIENISVLGFGKVLNDDDGLYQVSEFQKYTTKKSLNEIL